MDWVWAGPGEAPCATLRRPEGGKGSSPLWALSGRTLWPRQEEVVVIDSLGMVFHIDQGFYQILESRRKPTAPLPIWGNNWLTLFLGRRVAGDACEEGVMMVSPTTHGLCISFTTEQASSKIIGFKQYTFIVAY